MVLRRSNALDWYKIVISSLKDTASATPSNLREKGIILIFNSSSKIRSLNLKKKIF